MRPLPPPVPPTQLPTVASPGAPVPYAPPGTLAPAAAAVRYDVTERKDGPGYLLRAAWFLLVGWWLTGIVTLVAWLALMVIVGIPLGIWLINRIPTALTLRPRTSLVHTWTDAYGRVLVREVARDQPPLWVRGLWFVFAGWWLSGLVMLLGYGLVITIIGLPLGVMVFNRVPFAASLYRY